MSEEFVAASHSEEVKKSPSNMQLFCSHCWREINVKVSGSLWSLGKRCKFYTDKSTSCSITCTAELAQKSYQTIEGKEESWSSQGYALSSLPLCTPTCFQDEKNKNLQGRVLLLSQPSKLGHVEVNGVSQQQQESEGLHCLTSAARTSAVDIAFCLPSDFLPTIWLSSRLIVT